MSTAAILNPSPRALTPIAATRSDFFEATTVHDDFTSATLSIPMLTRTASRAAASYRVLAHRLDRQGAPQVVAVTSARPGEGKTTLALNLAVALAEQSERPVLLVEATRRRPALAAGFGICISSCFDEQLHQVTEAAMRWCTIELCAVRVEMLAVSPDGASGEPAATWVYRRLIEHARRRYAHVVVDCPSVACAGEVSVLDDLVDGTVLVARGKHTRAGDLRRAVDQLAPSRLLGTVLVGGEV